MKKKERYTARFIAAQILCTLYQERKAVSNLFDTTVAKLRPEPKERNLAMQLLYGVLRNRVFLDKTIASLSKTPLKKLHPFVHQAIAVGLYQIYLLDRIPESAAVNEAVNSCKVASVPKRLHGFVNGVLRQAIRQKSEFVNSENKPTKNYSTHNHPDWLVKRWQNSFGSDNAETICKINNLEPQLTLRINSNKISRDEFCKALLQDGIEYEKGKYSPQSIILDNYKGSLSSLHGFADGLFQVQDEAAQLASFLLNPMEKGGKYLDACAGLGGKTTHLLQFADQHKQQVEIHCIEPDHYRFKKLQENINRCAPSQLPRLHKTTLQGFKAHDQSFNGILLDAPCSGTGVIRKNPDIRWNRREKELADYQKRQLELLHHSARLVCVGGILVYATCSLEPEENATVIQTFLTKHPEFQLSDCKDYLPGQAQFFVKDKCFCPLPGKDIEGFFAARLIRQA